MTIRSPSIASASNDSSTDVPSGPLSDGSSVGAAIAAIALVGVLAAVSYPLVTAAGGSLLVAGLLGRWLVHRREGRRTVQREGYTPLG